MTTATDTKFEKRFKLRIKRLDFISCVDRGAQGPVSDVALLKRADNGEVTATFQVAKVSDDPALGLVFGWAFASSLDGGKTPHVDSQEDAIESSDELIKACAEFMEGGGAADVQHDGEQDGRVVFMMPLLADVKAALGISSDVEGVAVAIKPSPETYKRFKSGELNSFSLAGTGERSPLEKSATEIAKAEIERQAAEAAAGGAEEAKLIDELLAFCDEMAAKYGIDAGREVAQRHVGAVGKWGRVWLEKNAARVEKAGEPEPFEKAMARRSVAFAKAQSEIDAFMKSDAYAKAKEHGPEREAFAKLYAAHDAARKAFHFGDVEAAGAPILAKRDAAWAAIVKMREEYMLAHPSFANEHEAGARLEKHSSAYQALHKTHAELDNEWRIATAQVKAQTAQWHRDEADKLEEAEALETEKRAKAKLTPSETVLASLAEKRAAEKGITFAKAMAETLGTEAGRALYAANDLERRQHGSRN